MGFLIGIGFLLFIFWAINAATDASNNAYKKRQAKLKSDQDFLKRQQKRNEEAINDLLYDTFFVEFISKNKDDDGKKTIILSKDNKYRKLKLVVPPWKELTTIKITKSVAANWDILSYDEYNQIRATDKLMEDFMGFGAPVSISPPVKEPEPTEIVTVVLLQSSKSTSDLHKCIVSRADGTFTSVQRKDKPFTINEKIKVFKSKCDTWDWIFDYSGLEAIEKKYATQLLEKTMKDMDRVINLSKHNIKFLYHMTHKDNLGNILQRGLKSHNEARNNNLTKHDIADQEVNNRRSRIEGIHRRSVHSYVPLYFNPKNPMLYRRKDIQHEIVIIAVNATVIYNEQSIFTDGNAASNATKFFNNPATQLDLLDWPCILGQYWNDITDGKRVRCAEVLVYPSIPITEIKKIYCSNQYTKQSLEYIMKDYPNIPLEINPNIYFS